MTPDNQSSAALEERDERVLAAIEAYPEAYKGFALEACKIARRLASRQQGEAAPELRELLVSASEFIRRKHGLSNPERVRVLGKIKAFLLAPALPAPALPVAHTASCIGKGGGAGGCGYESDTTKTCPKCGGMVLTYKGQLEASQMAYRALAAAYEATTPPALSEGMTGWRLLNHGEVIEKTDEFYRPGMGVWILISGPGFSEGTIWRDTHLPVRRRLSSPAPTQKAGEV